VWAFKRLGMPPDVARRQSIRDLYLLNDSFGSD
jgi:hypothetical protein